MNHGLNSTNLYHQRHMAAFNPKSSKNHYRVRSVSLPTRSHPSTIRIEQVVNKLKTWETSSSFSKADKICLSLPGLKELYEGIEELLALPLTQQVLSQHQQDPRVNELVEESMRYIDVCSNTRDTVMQMKEGIKGLQSSLRRSKLGELRIESDIASFMCSRKNLHKEISRSLAKLKQVANKMVPSHLSNISEDDQLSVVLRALSEASLLTISSFSSLLLFLSAPVMKSRPTRWSLVSKLFYKGVLACEGERNKLNELENVDMSLGNLLIDDSCKHAGTERIEAAQRKLEVLETILESLENGLELLFRHLIRTRVSLLNILSQ